MDTNGDGGQVAVIISRIQSLKTIQRAWFDFVMG
jgi:hypothetical protein